MNADDPVKGTPSGNELLALQYALIFPTPSEDSIKIYMVTNFNY